MVVLSLWTSDSGRSLGGGGGGGGGSRRGEGAGNFRKKVASAVLAWQAMAQEQCRATPGA